jgi:hypothetical protein
MWRRSSTTLTCSAVALLCAPAAIVDARTQFDWLPAAVCADASDSARCRTAQPRDWTAADRRVVQDALDRLAQHPLAAALLAGARANGYRGLQRYASDVQANAAGEYVTKFGPGFVLYVPKIIGITDAFFELAELRDARGGYRVGDLVLLHEIVHAYDDRQVSSAADFTSHHGWHQEDGAWQYRHRVNLSEYHGVYARTLTLYAQGRYADAWDADRAFATSLAVPLPRMQALASPAETFADVLSHLVLDPTAREYLAPATLAWFDRHIERQLRLP